MLHAVFATVVTPYVVYMTTLCYRCFMFLSKNIIMQQSPHPPCRGSPAPVFAEAPGSTSAGDVGCDVEGGASEEHQALWESGGVCVLGD